MFGWMARLKEAMPLLHLLLVQSDLAEHGDPVVYLHSFVHVLSSYAFFGSVMAMTVPTLNCEAVDGSIDLKSTDDWRPSISCCSRKYSIRSMSPG